MRNDHESCRKRGFRLVCWLQRYAATRCNVMPPLATKRCTIIPPPISDETRHPVQSNPATGSEEVVNLNPIQGAARYLTVGDFASEGGRSLELAECMVRRVNAREKFRMKESLRQCIRPLGGEFSPGLDEIRRVPVL